MDSRRIVVALLTARLASAAQNCFWRSNDQINAMGSGWFACNNTQVEEGGAQLCCINGSKCGQDSICLKGVDYYVGGCTDGSYANPVCRTSCTGDSQTWIQYNGNTKVWECCGNNACDGSPPTETFSAIARASWSPIQTAPQSSSTSGSTLTSSSSSVSRTTDSSTAPSPTNTGNEENASDDSAGSSLSSGAKIGIGVACGLFGLAAILAVALLLLKRYKKRRTGNVRAYVEETKNLPEPSSSQSAPSASQKNIVPGGFDEHHAQELMSRPQTEMSAESITRAELEGGLGHAAK